MSVIKFPDMFGASAGKVSTVEGADEAKQCIKCALQTVEGELFGDPSYGSNIRQYMFENITDDVRDDIAQEIKRVANKYSKDLVIQQVGFKKTDPVSNTLEITIYYYIKSQGIEDSTSITY